MFYLFLLAHLVADFILQPYWLVQRKQHLDGLAIHCGIVLACMALLPLLDPAVQALWPAMIAITLVHFGADWWKVNHGSAIPGPPIVPFLVDQLIHITTLVVVLGMALPPEQIWPLASSPASMMALIGSAYVIAAFATPIGVMIWLDPRFEHLTQAGWARIRSFVAGIGVVSLMLIGGALALPAALLGVAVAARKPFSGHPLDAPTGMLAVMTVAAALGAVMLLIR
jgi:hypothetical protein